MVPIPAYIRAISQFIKAKENLTFFSVSCPCGCNRFYIYQNALTPEEKTAMKPWADAALDLYGGKYGAGSTVDENGIRHKWKLLSPLGLKGEKIEIVLPEKPYFSGISVIKAVCEKCGEEFVLFDSRSHGYDGKTEKSSDLEISFCPHFKQKVKEPVSIEIKIENEISLEEFIQNTGLQYSEDEYSDAFSWIVIYASGQQEKKKKIFDYETA